MLANYPDTISKNFPLRFLIVQSNADEEGTKIPKPPTE
jgi:hypothetical protein